MKLILLKPQIQIQAQTNTNKTIFAVYISPLKRRTKYKKSRNLNGKGPANNM